MTLTSFLPRARSGASIPTSDARGSSPSSHTMHTMDGRSGGQQHAAGLAVTQPRKSRRRFFPLTSSSFFQRSRERHYRRHHECYYRPACVRCYVLAALGVLVLAINLDAKTVPRRGEER